MNTGDIKELTKALYKKVGKQDLLNDDVLAGVESKYGDDYVSLINDFYKKHRPEKLDSLTDDVYSAIGSKYGFDVKKKEETQGVQVDGGQESASEAQSTSQPDGIGKGLAAATDTTKAVERDLTTQPARREYSASSVLSSNKGVPFVARMTNDPFEPNPELANEVYEALGFNVIKESEITYTDEDGKPCAKMGGRSSKFTKGSQWEIVKDLKGYPSHAQGGVDIKLGKDGFSFTRDNGGDIKAAHGLVLPAIKDQEGLVMSNTNGPSNNDTNGDVKFEPMELPYYYYKSDAYKQKTMDNYDRLDWDNFFRDHDYKKTKTVLSAKDYPELKNVYLAQQSRSIYNANDYATFDDFYNANKDNGHGGLFPKSYMEELYNLRDKYKTYDAAEIATDYDSYKHSKENKKALKYFDKLAKMASKGELKFAEVGKLAEEYASTLGKGKEFFPKIGSGQQYFKIYSTANESQDIFNEENYKKVAEINKDKESYFNYLSSDDYANVAKKTWGDNYNDMINIQKRRINNTTYTDFDYNEGIFDGHLGYYDRDKDVYTAPLHRKTTIDHELGHATDSFKQNNPNSKDVPLNIEHYDKFIKENNISEAYNIDEYKENMEYYTKPSELRTIVNVLRKNLIEQGMNIDSLDESALSDYFNSILNIEYDIDEFVSRPNDPSNLKNMHNYLYSDRHPMYPTIYMLKPIGVKNILKLLKEYAFNNDGNKIDEPLNDNINLA